MKGGRPSYLILIVVALLSSHAYEIGRVIIWARRAILCGMAVVADDKPGCGTPSKLAEIEAGLLAVGIGFVAATLIALTRALRTPTTGGSPAADVVNAAVVALVGCAFAIMKSTWTDLGPTGMTAQALFYWALLAWLVVTPIAFARVDNGAASVLRIWRVWMTALLVGGVLTAVPQVAAEQAFSSLGNGALAPASGLPGPFGERKDASIVAPTAYGLLVAPWLALALHPHAEPNCWRFASAQGRWLWTAAQSLAALSIAAAYAAVDYAGRQAWLEQSALGGGSAVGIFLSVLAPVVAAALIAWAAGWMCGGGTGRPAGAARALGPTLALILGVAGAGAAVALILWGRTSVTPAIAAVFVATQAVAGALTVLAVDLAFRSTGSPRPVGVAAEVQASAGS